MRDMFFILDCPDLDELVTYFNQRHKAIRRFIPKPSQLLLKTRANIECLALEEALEETTISIDSYWNLVSLVSLGIAALPVTVVVLGLTGVWGVYNFCSSLTKIKKENTENIQFFQLSKIKSDTADCIISRLQERIGNPAIYANHEFKPMPVQHHLEDSSVKSAVLSGAKVTFCLYAAYYLAIAWIFDAVAMASVLASMMTPVGFCVAAAVAVSVGAYCAYQYYQADKASKVVENEKTHLSETLKEKHNECHRLKGIAQAIGFFSRKSISHQNDAYLPRNAFTAFL